CRAEDCRTNIEGCREGPLHGATGNAGRKGTGAFDFRSPGVRLSKVLSAAAGAGPNLLTCQCASLSLMSRPVCSVFITTSLDGYVARRDGSIDWLDLVHRPGEDYGYGRFWEALDAVVIGRGTYETALGFPSWPYAGKRCVVLTHAAFERRHDEEFHA